MRVTTTTIPARTTATLETDDGFEIDLSFTPTDYTEPQFTLGPDFGAAVVTYLVDDHNPMYRTPAEFFTGEWCGGEDSSDFWREFDTGPERDAWIWENLSTCRLCGEPAGDHPFTDIGGDTCETFEPRVTWTDRMFWIERYEHGLVNYAPTGHASMVDRRWDVSPGVAILTIPADWGNTDTPEGLFSAACQVCESYTAWCNGWVYGVVTETFRRATETIDGYDGWTQVSEEACWGYVGEENAQSVADEDHRSAVADLTVGACDDLAGRHPGLAR